MCGVRNRQGGADAGQDLAARVVVGVGWARRGAPEHGQGSGRAGGGVGHGQHRRPDPRETHADQRRPTRRRRTCREYDVPARPRAGRQGRTGPGACDGDVPGAEDRAGAVLPLARGAGRRGKLVEGPRVRRPHGLQHRTEVFYCLLDSILRLQPTVRRGHQL